MNALDIKYKTDYITLHDVGPVPKGTIVRRSKWVIDGLGEQDKYHINNDEYSVVMHVYFYNYEYWEGDCEMVDSGVVKGENAIVAYAGAENAIKEEIGDRGFVITVFKKVE